MDISEEFIRAHKFPFPDRDEYVTETPFTIEFAPELSDIELFLDDVFDGGDPFYMPGVCRPRTPRREAYSVGALACPMPDSDGDRTYDIHYPCNQTVWFDVCAGEMEVYVRETVPAPRIKAFCDTLGENYGVELHEVSGPPAIPQKEQPL